MKILSKLDSLDNVQDGSTRKLITKTTSSGSGNVVSSVSVSGDTITYTKGVTALTGHQNAFSNVKIGSSTVAADQAGDTLELVAGSNITLTPDTTNDKVAIAATDTTYESKAAASGGTDVSLVTTGEKYVWNNKADSSALGNYVTLATEQTITGNKTFNSTLKMSNINNATYTTSSTSNISPSVNGLANPPWNKDLWHDHFAFMRYHSIDSQEVTTDGTTWTTATKTLNNLFVQKELKTTVILNTDELAYRFTLKNSTFAYSGLSWFEIAVAYCNPFSSFEIWIEHSADKETWSTCHKSTITGNSQPFFLKNGYTIQADGYTRFTFTKKSNETTGRVILTCLKGLCTRKGDQGLGIEYEYPYDWDSNVNLLPISNNNKNLGSSDQKWANVYATTFNGQLNGSVSSSTTATTQSAGDNSTKIATTAYVDSAITALPEPMIFKGSLGTGGTITTLPAASSSNEGFTYKVITAGTYASQAAKVGDTFISDGSTWVLIPSGDEPSGTVTSVKIQATSPITIDSDAAITTSGTRTLSHANSGVTAGIYRSVTVNATGHVTAGTNPTTLSGYGITDAKIADGVITLGSNTIAPIVSKELTNHDLNNINIPDLYYAGGGNTTTNKPTNVDAYGLKVFKTAGGYITQELIEGNTTPGKRWTRQFNGGSWSSWVEMKITDTDTKNTAGSTDTSSKIYLIGATSQAANPQTYSDNEVYATSGVLTTKSVQVGGTAATMQYNSTDKCIEFVFV